MELELLEHESTLCRWFYDALKETGTGHIATYSTSKGMELWTRDNKHLTLDASDCTVTIVANVLYFAGFGSDKLLRTILASCSELSIERSAVVDDTSPPRYTHH